MEAVPDVRKAILGLGGSLGAVGNAGVLLARMRQEILSMNDLKRLTAPLPGWMDGAKAYTLGPLRIIMSDNDRYDGPKGDRWRHVSVSCEDRLPTYDELCNVRARLFPPRAVVIQIFPPKSEHVNNHAYCLHLWWNKDRRLTPKAMQYAVGVPGINDPRG